MEIRYLLSEDNGADSQGGAAPSDSDNDDDTTDDDTNNEAVLKALRSERKNVSDLRKQLKKLEAAASEADAGKAAKEQIAAALKALGHDDGSNDPEKLQTEIQRLTQERDKERQINKTRSLRDRFAKAAGNSLHDVDAAFQLSGLSIDDDSDDAVTAAVESLKDSKSFLFKSAGDDGDSGDRTPNPGADGPGGNGVKKKRYSTEEYAKITASPEYLAQRRARKGDLYEEMKSAARENRVG